MVEVVKTLSGLLNPNVLVENIYAFTVLTVFLTMYGPRLHMRLPPSLMELFDGMIFRAAILFLIVYMSNRDFVGALTIVIIFTVTMNILHTNDVLINYVLNANYLNTDTKKSLALFLIHITQNGDSTGSNILKIYYDLVNCLL